MISVRRRRQIEQSRLEQLHYAGGRTNPVLCYSGNALDVAMVQSQAPLNMLQAALRLEANPDSRAAITIQTALDARHQRYNDWSNIAQPLRWKNRPVLS